MMTAIIIMDESGDLGISGSKYFTISSVISESSRNLKHLVKYVSSPVDEMKFSKTDDENRKKIIAEISRADIKIIYSVVNKNKLAGRKSFGSGLYKTTLLDVIDRSLKEIEHVDVHIIVDSSYNISKKGFEDVCGSLCDKHGKHLKKCYKGISQNDPCVRIADFVAGAIGQCYNGTDNSYLELLRERLIDARK